MLPLIVLQQLAQVVRFNETTRPETIDKQLSVGPQLVFPVPEEFAMPGVSEVNHAPGVQE